MEVLLGAPWHNCSSLFGPCLRSECEEEEVEEREEKEKREKEKDRRKNGKMLNLETLGEKNKR
jgi:hypothetical protein